MKTSNTAERLKEYMNLMDVKQADILLMCEPYCIKTGVKLGRNDMSQYVSGKIQPRQDKLSVLAAGMGVDETWLMGYDVPMYSHDSHDAKNDIVLYLSEDEARVITAYRNEATVIKNAVKRLLDIE